MEKYIASYLSPNGKCWDLVLYAKDWKGARKEARKHRSEYGVLYSVRRKDD